MNWVGGSLSRHRRGKGWKEDMAHQEEYFAKARTRQHDQMKTSPAILSAANFIPNYSALSEAAPSEATGITSALRTAFSLPVLFTQPLDAADEASANLDAPPKDTQRDVAEMPLLVLPRQTNGTRAAETFAKRKLHGNYSAETFSAGAHTEKRTFNHFQAYLRAPAATRDVYWPLRDAIECWQTERQ
ncbi:hypothetical protein ACHAQJ_002056 [Trichoderma viride]